MKDHLHSQTIFVTERQQYCVFAAFASPTRSSGDTVDETDLLCLAASSLTVVKIGLQW